MNGTGALRRGRWPRVLLIVSVVALLFIGAAVFLVLRSIPDYRTAFLVDTSVPAEGKDYTAVADALGAAAENSADGDSMSLRRFGGACGDEDNTLAVVGAGTGHAQKISTAVHRLTPSGNATLESGVLAATDDFSGHYPFHGSKGNRIIVVTSHGTDACSAGKAAFRKKVRDRAESTGVRLDFRIIGYKVPRPQRQPLEQIAAAVGAPGPEFVASPARLNSVLKQIAVPSSPGLDPVHVPTPTPTPAGPTVTPQPSGDLVGTYALSDGTLRGKVPDTNWSWIYEEERKTRRSAEIRPDPCAAPPCGVILHWDTSVAAHGANVPKYDDLKLKRLTDGSYSGPEVRIRPTLVEAGAVRRIVVTKKEGTEDSPITLTWQGTRV
ncbi:hypothetical protein [Actinomadura sp. DC4]|uniref:hypothetical protein n=1 Tax=Actinomadura sp. DC4 TaxID=3055069 RepID=UPI0025B23DD5|nr:hypothetical protein [Actinomadura sp. DC4]MDN3358570.1 hypothetical protein [Actinomadura sp. DC4]